MLDVHPLLAGPAMGFRPKGRLARVPGHGWGFLTHDIARAGLVTMDDEMAIVTRHTMPRRPAHAHVATATAGTRRAPFADTLYSNPIALQGQRDALYDLSLWPPFPLWSERQSCSEFYGDLLRSVTSRWGQSTA